MNKNFNYSDDDGDITEDQRLQILNGILAQQKQQEQHQAINHLIKLINS